MILNPYVRAFNLLLVHTMAFEIICTYLNRSCTVSFFSHSHCCPARAISGRRGNGGNGHRRPWVQFRPSGYAHQLTLNIFSFFLRLKLYCNQAQPSFTMGCKQWSGGWIQGLHCIDGGGTGWSGTSGPGLSAASCGGGGSRSPEEGGKSSDAKSVGDDSGSQRRLFASSCGGGSVIHGRTGVAESNGEAPGWQRSLTASSCGIGSESGGQASESESAIAVPGWRRRYVISR